MPGKTRINRRQFLATTTGAAFLSHFGPSRADALIRILGSGQDATSHEVPNWKDEGVIDLSKSPYAKLKSVPIRAVTIQEGFWSKRRATNVEYSIPSMHDELLAHGRMENFLRLEGKSSAPQRGPVFSDSDIYKWLEAVGFVLQSGNDPDLRRAASSMISEVIAAQETTGYLNTYYVDSRIGDRMLPKTQEVGHELYCLGHLLQAAIAYYRATGDSRLLKAGVRFVDDFLLPNYGPSPKQKPVVAGHPEIEMSMIELYRTTGNRDYLNFAGYVLRGDSRIPLTHQQIVYMFCGVPFTSRTKLEGHAVRAMYACCGATDYYLETGDPEYLKTLNTLWTDLYERQMYVTGGVGARSQGESFGHDYELPNARAYGESCAAIGNMMWNWRMLAASGNARFTDVIERALYNGINSGMSLDGKIYCYRNPLAFDPFTDAGDRHTPQGKIRNPWYDTTCCPPNLERTLASLPGYFYSTSSDGIYVHLYDNSSVRWKLASGNTIQITQKCNYPWEGNIAISVAPGVPETFTLYVRIPGWSRRSSVYVNGTEIGNVIAGQYLALRRQWMAHDLVDIRLDMTPQIVEANPAVNADTGRVAIQRGPIVYCMEQLDQTDGNQQDFPAYSAYLSDKSSCKYDRNLLDGVVVVNHPGAIQRSAEKDLLYRDGFSDHVAVDPTELNLIPYYAWANREPTRMQVWIPYLRS